LEHPLIKEALLIGYPYGYENDYMGDDALGNEIYKGDEVFYLNDEYFLKDALSSDATEILELLGAETKIAK
jgi:hypothetical protein